MLFIAEIGLNHNGNFGLIPELVKEAARANANIVKFQLGWRDGPNEINQITPNDIQNIIDICRYYEIEPMFSIISPEAFEIAKPFNFNRYKIASRTVKDLPQLVEKVLKEGKETFISLGFWEGEGLPFGNRENIRYLWCKSLYPTLPWNLDNFPKDFTNSPYTGYSDHTIGIETALLSIARGAKVVEKHFTLDKSDTTIRDHALSATPDEFCQLVELGTAISRNISLGI